jgi:hypothetical protein
LDDAESGKQRALHRGARHPADYVRREECPYLAPGKEISRWCPTNLFSRSRDGDGGELNFPPPRPYAVS